MPPLIVPSDVIGAGPEFLAGQLGSDVVTRREHLAFAGENDDPHCVIGLGSGEGLIELDQHPAVLGIALVRPIQRDPHDRAVVKGLPFQELVVVHGSPSTNPAIVFSVS